MHQSVLLSEAIDALKVDPAGCYIDGTMGAGGHSQAILQQLGGSGQLLGYDKDPQVLFQTVKRINDDRLLAKNAAFSQIGADLDALGLQGKVDGILLDLGVSSMQLDQAERGFSFRHDGPLDMRMNPHKGIAAHEWLADCEERELADVLWRYGDERRSRAIARAVIAYRQHASITTTAVLSEIVQSVISPRYGQKHPATRTFQAIRIYINQELHELEAVLPQCATGLAPGGRLVVISFHSLEDRRVKQFMSPPNHPVGRFEMNLTEQTKELHSMDYVARVVPSQKELARNPRARSAVMRIAEKR